MDGKLDVLGKVDGRSRWGLLALLVALAGCSLQPQPRMEPSGFLSSYEGMAPDESLDGALVYRKPALDLAQYDKVLLEPIAVALRPEAASQPVDPAQLAKLAEYFRSAIEIAMRDAYPLVDAPGERVLRLRLAITDVVPAKPVLNTAGTLVVPLRAASAAKRAITGTDLFVGEVAIEGEATDSLTNERLVAFVDHKAGSKFALQEGTTTWGTVTGAFREWAVRFRLGLDRSRKR